MNDVNFRRMVEKVIVKWCDKCSGCIYGDPLTPLSSRARKLQKAYYYEVLARSRVKDHLQRGFRCFNFRKQKENR